MENHRAQRPVHANRRSSRAQIIRRPSCSNDESITPSTSNTSSSRRHKSRSPSRSNSRNDPFDTSTTASHASSKLTRSSGFSRLSIASMEELSDPGQKIKSASSSAHLARHSIAKASSSHSFSGPSSSSSQSKKKEKGKERVPPSHHSSRSFKHLLDEHDQGNAFSGPIAAAEFERMKKEIEDLKSIVSDQKKTIKKQAKRLDEMRAEITSGKTARKDQENQIQVLTSKASKHEELVNTLETTFQCQICMDLLSKPFALSPCGHVLCVSCLQDWFRKAPVAADDMDIEPEDAEDPEYLLFRQKSCPCCRAIITRRPAPIFLIKNAVEAVKKHRVTAEATAGQRSESPLMGDEDPWEGLFLNESGNHDEGDDEYILRRYYADDLYIESDSDGLESIMMSVVDSGSESGEDDRHDEFVDGLEYQEEEDVSDPESLEGPLLFVKPRWEPPLGLYEHEELSHLDEEDATMLRRGGTIWLIQTCHLEYTHEDGFIAHLYALDNHELSYDEILARTAAERQMRKLNRLYLGWNLRMPFNEGLMEEGGKDFLIQTLELFKTQPWKFEVEDRPRLNGKRDLHVMIREEDAAGYDTTDSEYYGW